MFRGTFTALVTPFRADGTLDEDGVVRLLERQLKSGVQGLVLCGTTGEEASLTLGERKRLVEIVQKRAEGHIFIVASASDNITERAVKLAQEMDWLGVDAIMSVVPYFIRPNQAGILEHFRRIADAVQTPLIVSNAPARAGTGLEADTVALLAEHGNIRGIDESSGDLDFLSNILAATDVRYLRYVYLIPGVLFAGVSNVDRLWIFANLAVGSCAIPNLIAVLALSGPFFVLMRDYVRQENRYATAVIDRSREYVQ